MSDPGEEAAAATTGELQAPSPQDAEQHAAAGTRAEDRLHAAAPTCKRSSPGSISACCQLAPECAGAAGGLLQQCPDDGGPRAGASDRAGVGHASRTGATAALLGTIAEECKAAAAGSIRAIEANEANEARATACRC